MEGKCIFKSPPDDSGQVAQKMEEENGPKRLVEVVDDYFESWL